MHDILEFVRKEMKNTADAILQTSGRIDDSFVKAVELMYNCKGKIVVTGMGKTGLIGRKIAATLASTGTTSIFLHSAEGIHGDLGILDSKDIVLAISYSGNTQELVSIIPFILFHKIPIIAITGNKMSQLAKSAEITLDCSVPAEYEPFGLVPTVSTTVALTIGDALAVALLKKRDFQLRDFAQFHPGGTIGKKLLLRVSDLMHSGNDNPVVKSDDMMKDAILLITSKGLGCASVVNNSNKFVGIITDGDLRRFLGNNGNIMGITAAEVMTKSPKSTDADTLAIEALNLMETNKITMLPVVNADDIPVGMLHMHDLINAGVVG